MKKLLVLLMLAGCGDNVVPQPDAAPLTWGDAERAWAGAWCMYAERCFPDQFKKVFADQARCLMEILDDNCAYRETFTDTDCSQPLPEGRAQYIEQCVSDMENIHCSATQVPTSCLAVFQ